MTFPTLSDLDLDSARRVTEHRYIRHGEPTPEGWSEAGGCPGHHGHWSRIVQRPHPPVDPMEAFAEVPRMLPTFSTKHGLRMSYVDSKGKQRCLTLKVADLTRIMHSAAVALEIVTREQTIPEQIDALAERIMAAD
jgi:hypothetical protein